MARLKRPSIPEDQEEEFPSQAESSTRQAARRSQNPGSLSPSPAASFSSDKENRAVSAQSSRNAPGKTRTMPPPRLPTPGSVEPIPPQTNKRRRLGERDAPNRSQSLQQDGVDPDQDLRYYDPDQPMEERRHIRKGYRDLARELIDSRTEYMAADSTGLMDTIVKANDLYKVVKQTSDATLDSRLLVSTADITARRSVQLKHGGSSVGVDVDDFVAKCVSYMRKCPTDDEASPLRTSTQRHRQRREVSDEESGGEHGADEGDEMNWGWLGRRLCFPNNIRPPVSGFLLGPLSVQKRVRKLTQRRERFRKQDPRDAIRPEEIQAKDIGQGENSNLTKVCTKIAQLLQRTQTEGQAKSREEFTDGMTENDLGNIMRKYYLLDDGGVSFFHFVINPDSFGQTVENLFYTSFLIRDAIAGIDIDKNGQLSLHSTKARSKQQIHDENISKHQAVFHLDYETWEDIIESFDIQRSIIPNRSSDEGTQVGPNGWYN
ncbi:nuclear protein [Xylographa opegraphella]|nr:nuclear protein [Xylographa opegraphella]